MQHGVQAAHLGGLEVLLVALVVLETPLSGEVPVFFICRFVDDFHIQIRRTGAPAHSRACAQADGDAQTGGGRETTRPRDRRQRSLHPA